MLIRIYLNSTFVGAEGRNRSLSNPPAKGLSFMLQILPLGMFSVSSHQVGSVFPSSAASWCTSDTPNRALKEAGHPPVIARGIWGEGLRVKAVVF